MPKVITIRTTKDINTAIVTLKRINTRLPNMTREGMRQWGKVLVSHLKRSAGRAGIRSSTGTLFNKGIRWEQGKKSDKGYLFMRVYGIYLDSMAPHWVSVHRGRMRLLRWARIARNDRIRDMAQDISAGTRKKFKLKVKPHPFIKSGYKNAKSELGRMFKRAVKRGIR